MSRFEKGTAPVEFRKRKRTKADYTAEPNYAEAADRIEVILDCLTDPNRIISKMVKVDRAGAARAIAYFRRLAAGMEADGDIQAEIWEFLRAHKQCIDWVMTGDPTCMIVNLAVGTCSQKQPDLRVV